MAAIKAYYVKSSPGIKDCPEWILPEVALVGRSNVGKSSLINTLVGQKNLAKTSNTPGKTRLLNFYNINEKLVLVDLPGYGYAKVSKSMQAQWQKEFQRYLTQRPNMQFVIQLIDGRHGPQANDEQMLNWLMENGISVVIVLTKLDKLSKNDVNKHIQQAIQALGVGKDNVIPFSAQSGLGKEAVWECILENLELEL